jgi:cytochrome oxidase Cu insertion factor (SCO1/SenC/PrrC family)
MESTAGIRGRGRKPRSLPGLLVAAGLAAIGLGVAIGVAVHLLEAKPAAAPTSFSSVVHERHGLEGQASWAAGTQPAPPINTLHDQTGHLFSLASLHGRTVAIVFFDSHCHQECPLEGRALASAEDALPRAQRPVLVAVSVNPEDSAASAAAAAREWGLSRSAPWHWLMGTHAQLAPIWSEYHIAVSPPVNGDIGHTEAVYLVDRRGYERSAYLYPFLSRSVTHDLRVLAAQRAAQDGSA